jgi:molybdopterin-guanine dinucleotide biosynthesis protein A
MVNNISGAILAGGKSRRFKGINKSKIVFEGKTIISGIIETFGDIFNEIIIVTNTPGDYRDYNDCKIIGDRILNKGPLGGIHSALDATGNKAVFVVAGDMPMLDKDIIIRQIDYFDQNNYDILIPRIKQNIEPLHGIYRKTLIPILSEYLEEENNYAIRDFLKKVNTGYFLLEESEMTRRAFTNINSPSDIRNVNKLL